VLSSNIKLTGFICFENSGHIGRYFNKSIRIVLFVHKKLKHFARHTNGTKWKRWNLWRIVFSIYLASHGEVCATGPAGGAVSLSFSLLEVQSYVATFTLCPLNQQVIERKKDHPLPVTEPKTWKG